MAVEVGARGVVADSLIKAASAIGVRGTAQKKLGRDVGMDNGRVVLFKMSFSIFMKKDWEHKAIFSDT